MAKHDIAKNVVWGAVDFMALPVVAALSFTTGEYDKVQSVSKDLDRRLAGISEGIDKAKKEWTEKDKEIIQEVYDDQPAGGINERETAEDTTSK